MTLRERYDEKELKDALIEKVNNFLMELGTGFAYIPNAVLNRIVKEGGQLEFHSHPYDNDCVPSNNDLKMLSKLRKETGQRTSKIVTPNGRVTIFDSHGVVEMTAISNKIDNAHKKALLELFGDDVNDK